MLTFFILILILIEHFVHSHHWINLGLQEWSAVNELNPITGTFSNYHSPESIFMHQLMVEEKLSKLPCNEIKGLSKGQMQLCHLHKDHIPFVSRGVRMGISECQWQFKKNRWNCTISDKHDSVLIKASRETAFTYAISTAGVVYVIARACRDGQLSSCGCSKTEKPKNLRKDWAWGGCGDNIEYGYKFAENFIDVREKEKTSLKSGKDKVKRLMNLHNNEAGRRLVLRKAKVTCKCHGVSGSCSLITCWQQLSSFREIGDFLKEKYEKSSAVKINKKGKLQVRSKKSKLPTAEDLVYVESSPDYCTDNLKTGSIGTQGRVCNHTSTGLDGCNQMCCGRGHNTYKALVSEKCNCKFNWCCWVQCETCTSMKDIYTCK